MTRGPGGPSNYWWAINGRSQGVTSGYPSLDNLRAACDHFVRAGLTLVKADGRAGGICFDLATALTGMVPPTGSYQHLSNNGQQIVVYLRAYSPLNHAGTILADALNALFGTPNNADNSNNPIGQRRCTVNCGVNSPGSGCAPRYYTMSQVFDIVFSSSRGGGVDDWKIYTGGDIQGWLSPNAPYTEFNSFFSGGVCAGSVTTYQNDYTNFCDPIYDTWTRAAVATPSFEVAGQLFRRSFLEQYRDAFVVPLFIQK